MAVQCIVHVRATMLIRHLSSVTLALTAFAYIRQSSGAGRRRFSSTECARECLNGEIDGAKLMDGEHSVIAVQSGVIAVQIGRDRRANWRDRRADRA